MRVPARRKRGIAKSGKLSKPPVMFWGMTIYSIWPDRKIKEREDKIMEKARGHPKIIRTRKRRRKKVNSMALSFLSSSCG
jgi:hypothetical protein